MEDILESFLVYHNLLYNQISRLSYGGASIRIEDSCVNYCLQSDVHRNLVRDKYPPNKLYVLKQSVSGASPHDLSATKGTLVGVIKNQDPMGNTTRWFVDNGSMKGFLESQYLEASEEAKLIEESAKTATSDNSIDLMSLDSPIKEAKRYSADIQSLYSNASDHLDSPPSSPPPNYENFASQETETRERYENIARDEFVHALFDFHQPTVPGTLSVRKGQALKVLMKHDTKSNPEWWLVEDRTGGKGYVPRNHLHTV